MLGTLVRRILPKRALNLGKQVRESIKLKILDWSSRSRTTANLFYLFQRSFSSEHQAVLAGRRAYDRLLVEIGETCALLRRNTHRLEKGLIMRPRRPVFAENFILETVRCYQNAVKAKQISLAELKWATDVLDEYFSVVDTTVTVDAAKQVYMYARPCATERLHQLMLDGTKPFSPYPHKQLKPPTISFDQLTALFQHRRSVRWYQDKRIDPALVRQATNIASLAPSACNRQSYHFQFCNDRKTVAHIADCVAGTKGFSHNLPGIIVVVGDLSAYPLERDRHLIYIDGSLAAMQLMLSLETLGLSSCPINWPDVDANERKLRRTIELADYERVVMLMAVGYADADGGIPFSQKKQGDAIFRSVTPGHTSKERPQNL